MQQEKSKRETKSRFGVFVRLSLEQQQVLEKDSKLLRWSIPSILREAYFRRLPMKLAFDKEGEGKFLSEFRRIGNNINQLTRAANSGDLVSVAELKEVNEQLGVLFRYVMRMDGIR